MTWSDPTFEQIAHVLRKRSGLTFSAHRQDSAELGIRRAMKRAGVKDTVSYDALLKRDSKAFDDLLVELTVGETYFFRELAHFEFIRQVVFPDIRNRGGLDHVIRAWSAGCASGEEAYSLAMLFECEGLAGKCRLLATDVSRAALVKARRGSYSSWSLRGEGAPMASKYLVQRGSTYVVGEPIRQRVIFDYLNLALDSYPSFATGTYGMDLILCRNVMIYFDHETIGSIARRFFDSLAPGGWLITASCDPPLVDLAPLEIVVTDWGVFYRRPLTITPLRGQPIVTDTRQELAPADIEPSCVPPQPAATLVDTMPAAMLAKASDPPASLPPSDDAGGYLEEARNAFGAGNYALASNATREHLDDVAAATLHVRSLANVDIAKAEEICAEAAMRHSLSTELHNLHAVLLMELGKDGEAVQAMRRVIYLDRTLAMAHFTMGTILRRSGDIEGARRAYRNARDLCNCLPPEETVPLSDGERASRLAEAAEAQLAIIEALEEDDA